MTPEELKTAEERIAKAKAAIQRTEDAKFAANIITTTGTGIINFYSDGDIRIADDRGTSRVVKDISFELRQAIAAFLMDKEEEARKEWEAL